MTTVGPKIRHCRRLYTDRPDPIVFMSIVVITSGRLYPDFILLHFFPGHMVRLIPWSSNFLRSLISFDSYTVYLDNLKGSVGLMFVKVSPIRVFIVYIFPLHSDRYGGPSSHFLTSSVLTTPPCFSPTPSSLSLRVLPYCLIFTRPLNFIDCLSLGYVVGWERKPDGLERPHHLPCPTLLRTPPQKG